MEEFDHPDLQAQNGKNGRSTFVVVDGNVYDLSDSDMWKEGVHMGRHNAGQDLTDAIDGAPHGTEVLDRFNRVGALKETAPVAGASPPPWVAKLLGLHLHPISVHFPQALLTLAPLFLIIFYVTHNVHFERACYYMAVAGWLTSFPTLVTGLFHWVYKYSCSTKGLYVFKLCLSILLFVYAPVVVYVHFSKGVLSPEPVDTAMIVLYVLLVPLTAATGHAGGKIVFG